MYVGDLIKTVAFDEVELTCLTGLLVFNPGEKEISIADLNASTLYLMKSFYQYFFPIIADAHNLKKREKVEESQKYVMSFLEKYEESKYFKVF